MKRACYTVTYNFQLGLQMNMYHQDNEFVVVYIRIFHVDLSCLMTLIVRNQHENNEIMI